MAPKKKMSLLTNSSSNTVSVFIPRHTWPEHLVVKDSFWDKALNNPPKASSAFENRSSNSFGSGTLLDHQVYWTLFLNNDDGEGSLISPRSVLEDEGRVRGGGLLRYTVRFEDVEAASF